MLRCVPVVAWINGPSVTTSETTPPPPLACPALTMLFAQGSDATTQRFQQLVWYKPLWTHAGLEAPYYHPFYPLCICHRSPKCAAQLNTQLISARSDHVSVMLHYKIVGLYVCAKWLVRCFLSQTCSPLHTSICNMCECYLTSLQTYLLSKTGLSIIENLYVCIDSSESSEINITQSG